MIFFFRASLPKKRYLSSRAPVLLGPQRVVICHTISWAPLKVLPIWLKIFICDSQLKREHQRRKHSLLCYKCMSHSQVPGYLLQCVPWQGFPRAGTFIVPLYSEGWSFSPKETPGDVSPLSGTACFQKTCRNNLPWRSGLF